MSLHADYDREARGVETVETEHGFATYMIIGPECYIEDIYVVPEKRKTDLASRMADQIKEIAREKGCLYLTGSVNGRFKDPTTSMKVLLAYGFKVERIIEGAVIFKMEL